jgi:hypothetical protein
MTRTMKPRLVLRTLLCALTFAALASQAAGEPEVACDSKCVQASLLRMGMNLEVSERIRKGDVEGALRLLNSMNVLEITPILQTPEDKSLAEMKRRVFRKLLAERSRTGPVDSKDQESDELNQDIDRYLKKYQ